MASEERPYYTILGLTRGATQEEIRRAYKRKVLIYHPDKAGPEGKERFQFLQQAYSVLSDEKKRKVYDQFGEHGLEMPGVDELGLLLSSQIAGVVGSFFVLAMLVLIILFLSFLCARVEHTVMWKWTSVWIPAYIFLIILALPITLSLFCIPCMQTRPDIPEGLSEEDAEFYKRQTIGTSHPIVEKLSRFFSGVGALGWFVFFVTISAGLQRDMEGMKTNWWHYFIPVFIGEGCFMLRFFLRFLFERLNIGQTTMAFVGVPKGWLSVWSFFEFVVIASRVTQLCLICAKVQTDITASWWVVFIPSYILLFASVVVATLSMVVQQYAVSAAAGVESPTIVTIIVLLCRGCCSAFFGFGVIYASVFMIIAKLHGTNIRLDYCLIPIFIILAFFLLALLCGCVYCCCSAASTRDDIRGMEEGKSGQPGQQWATGHEAAAATAAAAEAQGNEAPPLAITAAPGANAPDDHDHAGNQLVDID